MDREALAVLPVAGQHRAFLLQVLSWKGVNQALAGTGRTNSSALSFMDQIEESHIYT